MLIAMGKKVPVNQIRMPRFVTDDAKEFYWDTTNPIDAAHIRRMIKEPGFKPTIADLDRAHRAEDKRMMRAEKRMRLVKC